MYMVVFSKQFLLNKFHLNVSIDIKNQAQLLNKDINMVGLATKK